MSCKKRVGRMESKTRKCIKALRDALKKIATFYVFSIDVIGDFNNTLHKNAFLLNLSI